MGPPFLGESKGRPEDPYIGYIYGDTVDGSEIELTTWDIKFPAVMVDYPSISYLSTGTGLLNHQQFVNMYSIQYIRYTFF